jgi:type I restriction enzyme M protein
MADSDPNIAAAKDDAIKIKGYFIYPSQLFGNVAGNANTNESLNTDLPTSLPPSKLGHLPPSVTSALFADFDTTSNRLAIPSKTRTIVCPKCSNAWPS